MDDEKRKRIEELAAINFQKCEIVRALGMMNVPNEAEERKKLAINYAIAKAEAAEAKYELEKETWRLLEKTIKSQ